MVVCQVTAVTEVEKISKSLVLIFEKNGSAAILSFLKALISKEILDTSDDNTLFRGNSMATSCMTAFLKKEGEMYVKSVIQPVLRDVIKEFYNDPAKQGNPQNEIYY